MHVNQILVFFFTQILIFFFWLVTTTVCEIIFIPQLQKMSMSQCQEISIPQFQKMPIFQFWKITISLKHNFKKLILIIDILRNNDFWVFVLVDSLLIQYGCVFDFFFFFFFAYLCSQLEIVGTWMKQSEDRLL